MEADQYYVEDMNESIKKYLTTITPNSVKLAHE